MPDLPMCPRVYFAYVSVYFVHTHGCGFMCAVHTGTSAAAIGMLAELSVSFSLSSTPHWLQSFTPH